MRIPIYNRKGEFAGLREVPDAVMGAAQVLLRFMGEQDVTSFMGLSIGAEVREELADEQAEHALTNIKLDTVVAQLAAERAQVKWLAGRLAEERARLNWLVDNFESGTIQLWSLATNHKYPVGLPIHEAIDQERKT